jgi:riboflavin biosynthesis pyrimidine reductase
MLLIIAPLAIGDITGTINHHNFLKRERYVDQRESMLRMATSDKRRTTWVRAPSCIRVVAIMAGLVIAMTWRSGDEQASVHVAPHLTVSAFTAFSPCYYRTTAGRRQLDQKAVIGTRSCRSFRSESAKKLNRQQRIHDSTSRRRHQSTHNISILRSTTGNVVDAQKKISGVTLKLALDSSDYWGAAELKPDSTMERFTSPASLDMVHRLRRDSEYVLVGKNTVVVDDCSLTVRRVELSPERPTQPTRVILDPRLSLLPSDDNNYRQYKVFKDGSSPTIIYFSMQALSQPEQIQLKLMASNNGEEGHSTDIAWNNQVTLVNADALSQSSSGNTSFRSNDENEIKDPPAVLSPSAIVQDLQSPQRGGRLSHIMVEGGPMTARAFLEARLVDRVILVKAPIQFEEPLKSGLSDVLLKQAVLESLGSNTDKFDGDTMEYWSRPELPWPSTSMTTDSDGDDDDDSDIWDWP